jgi:secreted trypsin-like serine protease
MMSRRRRTVPPARARRAALIGVLVVGGLTGAGVGPATAVAHGTQVPEGEYRFAVKLTMPDIARPDGTHYSSACSAALVDPQWVVSAGHCFHDGARNRINGAVRYRVVATVGTADVDSGNGTDVDVVEVRQAPGGADVALARLEDPVDDVEALTVSSRAPRVGDKVRIAGWGWTGEGEQTPSTTLWTGTVKVVSLAPTTAGVVGLRPGPDTSACVYDSGAPYFVAGERGPRLVAVESGGPTCPHARTETTVRVDPLAAWIRRTVADEGRYRRP